MRKYYIDNVRILCVLLLFPFHSAYIFNNLNESFYTPANAWFILFLFIYSIMFLPLLSWYANKEKKINCKSCTLPVLVLLGILITLSDAILNIGGKSLVQFALCFLFGFFIVSDDNVQNTLGKHSTLLCILWIIFMVLRHISHMPSLWGTSISYIAYYGVTCFGILGMIGGGKRCLDKELFFTKYLARAEFALFLLHQTFVVAIGYIIVPRIESPYLAWIIIMLGSVVVTITLYEICKRFKVTRFLLSIK